MKQIVSPAIASDDNLKLKCPAESVANGLTFAPFGTKPLFGGNVIRFVPCALASNSMLAPAIGAELPPPAAKTSPKGSATTTASVVCTGVALSAVKFALLTTPTPAVTALVRRALKVMRKTSPGFTRGSRIWTVLFTTDPSSASMASETRLSLSLNELGTYSMVGGNWSLITTLRACVSPLLRNAIVYVN